jgi:hypothetical protein
LCTCPSFLAAAAAAAASIALYIFATAGLCRIETSALPQQGIPHSLKSGSNIGEKLERQAQHGTLLLIPVIRGCLPLRVIGIPSI